MNKDEYIKFLEAACRDIYEVWAGSEGIPMPETAPEGYLLFLVEQMRDIAKRALAQHEKEPVATLFGSLPVYDVPPKQEPVAWMHNFIDDVAITHRPVDLDRYPNRWTALYKNPTPCQTCEALARTVMMDQTSHDTPPRRREPPTLDLSAPLTVNGVPMYPQREWQGLTDEEIENCFEMSMFGTCRAIEAKLKEKNSD